MQLAGSIVYLTPLAVAICLASRGLVAGQTLTGCNPACVRGSCMETLNSIAYVCNCTGTGYTGPTCSNVSSPVPSPRSSAANTNCPTGCVNGDCLPQFNSPLYQCVCRSGFEGNACDMQSSATSPSSVSNDDCPVACYSGTCRQSSNSVYVCDCNAGYTGRSCASLSPAAAPTTRDVTSCPVPCFRGSCKADLNSPTYYCECDAGYGGTNCSMATSTGTPAPSARATGCSPACKHGTCRPAASGPLCECSSGFYGSACDQALGPAQASPSAERSDFKATGDIKGWAVFLICLVVVIGVLLLSGFGVLLYRRRQKRRTFVKFNESTFEPQRVEVLG